MRKQGGKRKVFYQRIHVLHWAWGLTFVITRVCLSNLANPLFFITVFYFFLLSILYFRFWFCVSVLNFVILFWVLCFFCDSVWSFVFLFWVLWFCLEFCVSVLGFVILFWVLCFCIGFCDSVSSFVFLFWVLWSCFVQYRPPYVLIYSYMLSCYTLRSVVHTLNRDHIMRQKIAYKRLTTIETMTTLENTKTVRPYYCRHSNRNVTQLSANSCKSASPLI